MNIAVCREFYKQFNPYFSVSLKQLKSIIGKNNFNRIIFLNSWQINRHEVYIRKQKRKENLN